MMEEKQKLLFDKDELLNTVEKWTEKNIITFPVKYREKKPLYRNWQKKQLTFPELEEMIKDFPVNLAVLAGKDSDNLVVLDFDDKYIYDELYESNEKFRRIADVTFKIQSGRGIHVYLRAPYAVKTSKSKKFNLDIKAQGSYCLTYPSIHPSGVQYVPYDQLDENDIFVYPLEDVKEIDFISLQPYSKRLVTPSLQEEGGIDPEYTWNALTPFYRDILRNKISKQAHGKYWYWRNGTPEKPDRSRADQAVLIVLVKNGYRFEDISGLYSKYAGKGSKYREPGNGRRYLKLSFDNAENYYFEHRNNRDEFIDAAFYIVKAGKFYTGRTRNSLKLVTMAILYVMKLSNKMAVSVAVRDIQSISGLANQTVQNAIIRLKELKYLVTTRESYKDRAETYRFTALFMDRINDLIKDRETKIIPTDPIKLQTKYIPTQSCKIGEFKKGTQTKYIPTQSCTLRGLGGGFRYRLLIVDLLGVGHDGFSRKSLNRNSRDLIGILNENIGKKVFLKDLVKETGKDPRTIQRKIDKLQKVVSIVDDLKQENGKGQFHRVFTLQEPITDEKLEKLAELTGTKGTAERRNRQISKERAAHKLFLDNKVFRLEAEFEARLLDDFQKLKA